MKAAAKNSDTGVAKQARHNEKKGSPEAHGRRRKRSQKSPEISESEEARALLEEQLHRLYWWVFNACRIKGFLRAKQLDALEAESELLIDEKNPLPSESAASAQHPATELK